MPALTIHGEANGFTLDYFAPWQWASHRDNPAQAYGEPYPDNLWILHKTIELYEYRRAGRYKQADATRQWLRDYGMVIEQDKDGVCVKW